MWVRQVRVELFALASSAVSYNGSGLLKSATFARDS